MRGWRPRIKNMPGSVYKRLCTIFYYFIFFKYASISAKFILAASLL